MGRYDQSDLIGLAGGSNRFLYTGANPLLFVDPFGLYAQCGGGKRAVATGQSGVYKCVDDGSDPNTKVCATAECGAGMLPSSVENRTEAEIAEGQCKLICSIVGPDNLIPGGKTIKKLGDYAGRKLGVNLACDAICEDPKRRKAFCGL